MNFFLKSLIFSMTLSLLSTQAWADTYQQGCSTDVAKVMTEAKTDNIQQRSNAAQGMYRYLHNASFSMASCIDSLIPSLSSSGFNLSDAIANAASQATSRLTSAACTFMQNTIGKGVNSWNGMVGQATSNANSFLNRYTNTNNIGLNAGSQTIQFTSGNSILRSRISGIYSNIAKSNGIDVDTFAGRQLGNAANSIKAAAFNNTIGVLSGSNIQ